MRSPKPSIVTSEPSIEPLTLAEVRDQYLKAVNDTDENNMITAMIKAARIKAENFTGRKFITQSVSESWDEWPDDGVLELGHANVLSITSITYKDTAGNNQTLNLSTDVYQDLKNLNPRIKPVTDWPDLYEDGYNLVTVVYSAGYGAATTDVPEQIRMAIRTIIARMYECRDEHYRQPLPMASEIMLSPYRVRLNV